MNFVCYLSFIKLELLDQVCWLRLAGSCLLRMVSLIKFAWKLFEVILLHEDITQRELKKSSPRYTCDLSPHRGGEKNV